MKLNDLVNRIMLWTGLSQLKVVSKAVLTAELFDLSTTLGGLVFLPQLWEANPLLGLFGGWGPTLLVKFGVTFLVIVVLEIIEDWPMLVNIVPITATLPGVWNLFCILVEFLV